MENNYNANKQANEPHGNFQNYGQAELTIMKSFELERPTNEFFYEIH